MSFPSSFGTQVAAIMDVLAKAAVAEISKLVEDGTMVLRLEMCRKDGEIQELNRTLKLLEIELRKAQEAAASRATEDAQVQTAFGNQIPDTKEDQESCAVFPDSKVADSLSGLQHEAEESSEMRPTVKHEPADELATQEPPADNTATADGCFKLSERDEPIWPAPSCSVLEKSSVEMQRHMQVLSTHAEQFAHRNAQSAYDSLSRELTETSGDCLSVPIKVEVDVQPVCMESTTSEAVSREQFRHTSHPAVSQNQCLQSASHRTGQPVSPPRAERCVTNTVVPNPIPEDPILSRNNLRAKRLLSAWRTSQKLFMCSVCNRGFPRLSQLEEHKATHQQIKPFRCLECGKSFTQKTRLKTHQSVHTGERPFSCKICGKMFSRQDNCLRHERFHSGLKPYSCGQCGKSFTVLGNLKIHQDIHLQGR